MTWSFDEHVVLPFSLPSLFLQEMQTYLGEDFASFCASFSKEVRPALRMNTNKFSKESFLRFFAERYPQVKLTEVPWTQDAFFYEEEGEVQTFYPGRELAYLAGFYYVQEASAMLPAQLLSAKKGIYLDLCAAPGGKSTKIASLSEELVLYSNDLSKDRAMILLRNLEQYGLKNTYVLQEDATRFAKVWQNQVDCILLDAPCSGEGMFRRDVRARQSYEKYENKQMIETQAFLLDAAVSMLKVGGELLYSTCTFNVRENEEQIYALLQKYPFLEVLDARERLKNPSSVSQGLLIDKENRVLCEEIQKKSLRLWPHLQEADGHYAILLRKREQEKTEQTQENLPFTLEKNYGSKAKKDKKTEKPFVLEEHAFWAFAKENFQKNFLSSLALQKERFFKERDYLHLLPALEEKSLPLEHLHLLKRGVVLGEEKVFSKEKKKFLPSHSFVLAYGKEAFLYQYELGENEEALARYLQGQSLLLEEDTEKIFEKAQYILLCYKGFAFGLVKKEGRQLKNLYPKSWVR